MGPMDKKLLVLLGIVIWLKQANAIDCYSCGVTDNNCNDPFKSSGTISCSGSCYKVKSKDSSSNANAAMRGCYSSRSDKDTCAEATYNGINGTLCVCNGNLCNYAIPVGSSIMLMAASIAIYIALHY